MSDVHLGDDHAFRYPVKKSKSDTSPRKALSEVLYEDLRSLDVLGQIGCVIISGDILTKGAWSKPHESGDRKLSGLDVAKEFLNDLSDAISVDPKLFCIVPGNHDIVRKASEPPEVRKLYFIIRMRKDFAPLEKSFAGCISFRH
ncbi:hypothetical protein ASC80_04415 [Afipia sp. Root123D2]|uniref:hypothetical protein n=1 Tax=Afipia sp. Root123D2 TaxID=1736436 RepID=UPI0006F9237E|nr:hypothetical protein [Afipia sp. Root123D2]KQW22613.1 hypothetical protein ASC80_04415 [Afipia sp. Root123D2]